MPNDYDQRKVDRFDADWGFVSTAAVNDAEQPYETVVKHTEYNDGRGVVVATYDTAEEAQVGHAEWVGKMTASVLPDALVDRGSDGIALLFDALDGNEDWRRFPRQLTNLYS